MIAFHKALIRLHENREEFKKGSLKRMAGEYNYLAYGRFTDRSQAIVLINNNDHEIMVQVPVWVLGVPKEAVMHRLIRSDAEGFQEKDYFYEVSAGKISVKLPATSAEIINYEMENL
jgi:alpha-glucosidase